MKTLGKVLLIVLAVVLTLAMLAFGCVFFVLNQHFLADMRSIAGAPRKYEVTVTQVNEGMRVELRNGKSGKYVVYNDEREVVKAVGITPINLDRRNFWGLWTYEEFLAEYGDPHGELPTSDIYWPVWFTDDGYLITMWCAGQDWMNLSITIGNYGEVSMYDLLETPE